LITDDDSVELKLTLSNARQTVRVPGETIDNVRVLVGETIDNIIVPVGETNDDIRVPVGEKIDKTLPSPHRIQT